MKTLFPKPFPLSPKNSKAVETEVGWRFLRRTGNTIAKGVGVQQSVYYWWLEYLRRNEEYRNACDGKNVSDSVRKVYEDFGNIFEFCSREYDLPETQFTSPTDFWKWWRQAGQWRRGNGAFLFSYQPLEIEPQFVDYKDLPAFKDDVISGDIKLIAISSSQSKAELRKQITELISEQLIKTPKRKSEGKHKPKYDIEGDVNIQQLRRDLIIWDARKKQIKGDGLLDIYIEVQNIDPKGEEAEKLKRSFKGIKNYQFGWEVEDVDTINERYGWKSDDEDDADIVLPPEIEQKLEELETYACKNIFTPKGFGFDEEDTNTWFDWWSQKRVGTGINFDKRTKFIKDACRVWAYVQLGLAKRTENFIECKKLRNKAYLSINRATKRAEANINAVGKGQFNVRI